MGEDQHRGCEGRLPLSCHATQLSGHGTSSDSFNLFDNTLHPTWGVFLMAPGDTLWKGKSAPVEASFLASFIVLTMSTPYFTKTCPGCLHSNGTIQRLDIPIKFTNIYPHDCTANNCTIPHFSPPCLRSTLEYDHFSVIPCFVSKRIELCFVSFLLGPSSFHSVMMPAATPWPNIPIPEWLELLHPLLLHYINFNIIKGFQ